MEKHADFSSANRTLKMNNMGLERSWKCTEREEI